MNAIYFDERARDGALNNGWFTHAHIGSGDMWDALYKSPWQSEIWQEAFPQYKNLTDDISKADTAEYIPNPACTIKGNLVVDKYKEIGDIYKSSKKFSDISDNAIYSLIKLDEIFVNADSGDYTVQNIDELRKAIPGFENIPLEKIGRITK